MKTSLIAKVLCSTVLILGAVLATTSTNVVAEDGMRVNNTLVQLNVESSCTMSSDVTSPHSATIANGTNKTDIGSTTLKVVCNDSEGWAIYALGYSNNVKGNTNMYSADGALTIPTGIATSGDSSNWSMKLATVSGTYTPTLDYAGSYSLIPSAVTKVAHYDGIVGPEGASIKTTYQAYVSPTQVANTYTGKVKYTLAHPKNETGGITSIFYMQDMSPSVCEDTITGAVTTLIDSRDGKEYYVAKLKDGNCWMVDNLRFAGTNAEGEKISINSSDSDLASGTFDMIGTTPSGVAYNKDTTWTAPSNKSEYYPDESKSGDQYYGYFYNWYAATAGTGTAEMTGGQNATSSICPKGWQLPHDYTASETDNKSYSDLLYTYGIIANIGDNSAYAPGKTVNDLVAAPLLFIRAGYHITTGTSVYYRGSRGYYWSSTAGSTTDARSLDFNSSSVGPQYNFNKSYGFSVRCVAR